MTDIRYTRRDTVTSTSVDGTLFLVATDSGEIVHLDEMATALWSALAVPQTRSELAGLFAEAFPDVDRTTLSDDIDRAVATLLDSGVVLGSPDP